LHSRARKLIIATLLNTGDINMKLEDFKAIIAVNPQTKFKFDLGESGHSFSQSPDVTGVITFDSWGNDSVIWAAVAGYDHLLSFSVRDIEVYKEGEKPVKEQTPFEKAGYTKDTKFKFIGEDGEFEQGETVWLERDDGTSCPKFTNGKRSEYLIAVSESGLDVEPITEPKKLKFPCCVPTSEIKDEETFKKILDLFVANGATKAEMMYSSVRSWANFGVDHDKETMFYDYIVSYSDDDDEDEVTVYKVEDLLATISGEETTEPSYKTGDLVEIIACKCGHAFDIGEIVRLTHDHGEGSWKAEKLDGSDWWAIGAEVEFVLSKTQQTPVENKQDISISNVEVGDLVEVITLGCLDPSIVSIGDVANVIRVDSDRIWSKAEHWTHQQTLHDTAIPESLKFASTVEVKEVVKEPLVTVLKDVTYKVIIKGYDITLSQDELNELVSELKGFEDYE